MTAHECPRSPTGRHQWENVTQLGDLMARHLCVWCSAEQTGPLMLCEHERDRLAAVTTGIPPTFLCRKCGEWFS